MSEKQQALLPQRPKVNVSIPQTGERIPCVVLCPSRKYDQYRRMMVCRILPQEEVGDYCQLTSEHVRDIKEYVEDLDFDRHQLIELLEMLTGKSWTSLRYRRTEPQSIWR